MADVLAATKTWFAPVLTLLLLILLAWLTAFGVNWGGSWIARSKERTLVAVVFGLVAGAMLAIVVLLPSSDVIALSNVNDPFHQAILIAQEKNEYEFSLWYRTYVAMLVLVLIFGAIASFISGMSTSANLASLKRYLLFSTIAATTLTGFIATFNFRDNIETLVVTAERLNLLEQEYLRKRRPFESEMAGGNVPEDVVKIRSDLAQRFADTTSSRMRVWANVGQRRQDR